MCNEEATKIEHVYIPYLKQMLKLAEKWDLIVPQNTIPSASVTRNIFAQAPTPPESIEQHIEQLQRKLVVLKYHVSWINWDLKRKALKVLSNIFTTKLFDIFFAI
jgi:hypothetical protein